MTEQEFKDQQIDDLNSDIEGLEQERDKLLQYVNATEGALMYAKGKRDKLQAELDATNEEGKPESDLAVMMANEPHARELEPSLNGKAQASSSVKKK